MKHEEIDFLELATGLMKMVDENKMFKSLEFELTELKRRNEYFKKWLQENHPEVLKAYQFKLAEDCI